MGTPAQALSNQQPAGQTVVELDIAGSAVPHAIYDFVANDGAPLVDMHSVWLAKDDSDGAQGILFTNEEEIEGLDFSNVEGFAGERLILHFDGFPFATPLVKATLNRWDKLMIFSRDGAINNTELMKAHVHIFHRNDTYKAGRQVQFVVGS